MSEADLQSETEELLLMAACVQGLGPETSLVNANSVEVINQSLRWRGLDEKQISEGWH
jgi:hypothetical protein